MATSSTVHLYYAYRPSMAAAIIFTVLFVCISAYHSYQLVRCRTWFMIPFLIGGVFETVGYLARTASASQEYGQWTQAPFIIQTILLLVAPALFAASLYMELGRIVMMVEGEKLLFIRRTWLTKIFVTGDVLSFVVQAIGAALLSSASDADGIDRGQSLILVGLGIQLAFFGIFIIACGIFHWRLARDPTQRASERPWLRHMIAAYTVSGLILIRSIVRVVEYQEGHDGYISSHEVFLYVFDALPMFAVMVTMAVIHPGDITAFLKQRGFKRVAVRDSEAGHELMGSPGR